MRLIDVDKLLFSLEEWEINEMNYYIDAIKKEINK